MPLMKQNGFKDEFTGSVEGSASNGGQILPPTIIPLPFLWLSILVNNIVL